MSSKKLAVLGCVWLAMAAGAASQSYSTNVAPDCIYFRNGDLLYGKLASIDPQSAVRWTRSDAPQSIEFKPDAISHIDFPPRHTAASRAASSCKIVFGNGDSLEGDLVSAANATITLDTWYAGRLSIPRRAMQSLAFTPRDPAVFDGITGLDGWTEGGAAKAFEGEAGDWVYRNGAFYTDKPASIARDLKLPGMADIQFDLAWKGGLNLAVALYTDSLQPILLTSKESGPDFGGFYSLRFFSSMITLMPIRKNDPLRSLGEIIIPALQLKTHAHIDLRVNKPEGKIALFFDDSLVKEWTDPAGFVGEGTGLRFVENPGGSLKLSNLRVTKWNGLLEADLGNAPELTHDLLTMETGSRLSGTVGDIANGQISLTTTNGPLEVPMVKAASIEFAHAPADVGRLEGTVVRAMFARGGAISCQLVSWSAEGVVLASPEFGRARFNPEVFSRLQFVPADARNADKSTSYFPGKSGARADFGRLSGATPHS